MGIIRDIEADEFALTTWSTEADRPITSERVRKYMRRYQEASLESVAKRGDRWTADEEDRLIEMRERGLTYLEIARALGRSWVATKARMQSLIKAGRIESRKVTK